jgi:hypothetical protein
MTQTQPTNDKGTAKQHEKNSEFCQPRRPRNVDRRREQEEGKKIKKGREGKKKLITFPAGYTPNTTAGAETSLRRASAVSLLPRAHARAPGVAAGSRADRTRT